MALVAGAEAALIRFRTEAASASDLNDAQRNQLREQAASASDVEQALKLALVKSEAQAAGLHLANSSRSKQLDELRDEVNEAVEARRAAEEALAALRKERIDEMAAAAERAKERTKLNQDRDMLASRLKEANTRLTAERSLAKSARENEIHSQIALQRGLLRAQTDAYNSPTLTRKTSQVRSVWSGGLGYYWMARGHHDGSCQHPLRARAPSSSARQRASTLAPLIAPHTTPPDDVDSQRHSPYGR